MWSEPECKRKRERGNQRKPEGDRKFGQNATSGAVEKIICKLVEIHHQIKYLPLFMGNNYFELCSIAE